MAGKACVWSVAILLAGVGLARADTATVSASNLNLRAGPTAGHAVLALMPHGARVEVIECGSEWCRLRYRGQSGYAMAAHLHRSATEIPAVAPAIATARAVGHREPDDAARVWRWQDPEWRDRHVRDGQWLRRHADR